MTRMHIGMLIVCAALLCAGWARAASPEEKALSKEFRKALITKDPFTVADLVPRLMDEGISDVFRLKYCQMFLTGTTAKRLNFECYKAVVKVLIADYQAKGKDPADPRAQERIRKLVKLVMGKLSREKELFVALLFFYRKVPDNSIIKTVKKMLMRFPGDTDVINAAFMTLKYIRLRDSVDIINDIYYQAWQKTDELKGDAGAQQALMFFGKISETASRSLESLTGQPAADAQAFNMWWRNNRGKAKIEPLEEKKPEPKKAEDGDKEEADPEKGEPEEADPEKGEPEEGAGNTEGKEGAEEGGAAVPEKAGKDGEG